MCLANIVFNEIWLNRGGLPQDEKPQQVGQWSTIVETVLVVIAIELDTFYGDRKNRKERVRPGWTTPSRDVPGLPIGAPRSQQPEVEGQSMPRWLASVIGVLSLGMIRPGSDSSPDSPESPSRGAWVRVTVPEKQGRERIGYLHPYARPPRRH